MSTTSAGTPRGKKSWLCLPLTVCALADNVATFVAQPADYWQGQLGFAQSGHPLWAWLLECSPWAFEAGVLVWVVVLAALVVLLPRRIGMVLSAAVSMLHVWGVSTWLAWRVPGGFWLVAATFIAAAMLLVVAWERSALTAPSERRGCVPAERSAQR